MDGCQPRRRREQFRQLAASLGNERKRLLWTHILATINSGCDAFFQMDDWDVALRSTGLARSTRRGIFVLDEIYVRHSAKSIAIATTGSRYQHLLNLPFLILREREVAIEPEEKLEILSMLQSSEGIHGFFLSFFFF